MPGDEVGGGAIKIEEKEKTVRADPPPSKERSTPLRTGGVSLNVVVYNATSGNIAANHLITMRPQLQFDCCRRPVHVSAATIPDQGRLDELRNCVCEKRTEPHTSSLVNC